MVASGSASNTLDLIQGAITVNGQGANTTLNVIDTGTSSGQEYQVFDTQITRTPYNPPSPLGSPTQTINYANVGYVNVHGGSGYDAWGADSTSSQTTMTALYSGGGTTQNSGSPISCPNRGMLPPSGLGIRASTTDASFVREPQGNGVGERFVSMLKENYFGSGRSPPSRNLWRRSASSSDGTTSSG